jgi:hypothetical protein
MQNIDKPEVCADAIVAGILRGMRRRGLPANVDPDDLRQEGLIALAFNPAETPAHAAVIAKNAMLDYLRKDIRTSKRYYTGVRAIEGAMVNSSGEVTGHQSNRVTDPFFVLDVDGLEARQVEWERERKERWA